jgi:hypothetical protein
MIINQPSMFKSNSTKGHDSQPKFAEGDYVKVSNLRTLYHICNPPMYLDDGWYYMVEYGKGNVDSCFIHESKLKK